jgi:hypothetical protein
MADARLADVLPLRILGAPAPVLIADTNKGD